ncbi:MAG: uroporphyrinogen-III C-methyltransferase [Pseudomonadota bacterium]
MSDTALPVWRAVAKPGRFGVWLRSLRHAAARLHVFAPPARALAPTDPSGRNAALGMGVVSLVGAGPGSADLITLRGVERLKAADIVYYDRLIDAGLLAHTRADAIRIYVGKAPGAHAWPQARINARLAASAREGLRVVRLKCGDPGIFARGAEEGAALDAQGIPWEIVPGVTAATAAAAAAGSFLTVRGQTDTLILTTGRLSDDPNGHASDTVPNWAAHLQPGTTLAVYMGIGNAGRLANSLHENGLDSDTDVEIICAAGTAKERICRTTVADLAHAVRREGMSNPAIILVRCPKRTGRQAATPREAVTPA